MKKLLCISLLWLNAACASQQSQVEQKIDQEIKQEEELVAPEKFATHVLLIFLDDSEEKIDAISKDVTHALEQQAGPILVSKYLIFNILMHPGSLKMDPQQWIIKELARGSLLLFIPKSYTPSNMQTAPLQNYQPTKPQLFSEAELALGLKIDHMNSINPKNLTELEAEVSSFALQDDRDYFMHALWNEASKTSEIFITKSDYANARKALGKFKNPMPQWAIAMDGHGWPKTLIASLTPKQFKDVTIFLDRHLFCKLLYYQACYAAGINMELVYKDLEKNEPVYQVNSYVIAFEGFIPKETISGNVNYNQFITNLISVDVIESWAKTIAPIISSELKGFVEKIFVKLPGQHWFTAQSIDDNLLSIGPVMAKSRTQPLRVKTFKKNISIVAFYAPVINFEIITERFYEPTFIFLIPGPAVYIFKKITGASLKNSISMMASGMYKNTEDKTFFIKEMEALNDPLILPDGQKAFKINDVIIELIKDKSYEYGGFKIYFEYQAKQYQSGFRSNKATEYSYKKEYQEVIDYAVKNLMEKFEEERAPFQHLEDIQQKKIEEIKKMPKLKKQSAAINKEVNAIKDLK